MSRYVRLSTPHGRLKPETSLKTLERATSFYPSWASETPLTSLNTTPPLSCLFPPSAALNNPPAPAHACSALVFSPPHGLLKQNISCPTPHFCRFFSPSWASETTPPLLNISSCPSFLPLMGV